MCGVACCRCIYTSLIIIFIHTHIVFCLWVHFVLSFYTVPRCIDRSASECEKCWLLSAETCSITDNPKWQRECARTRTKHGRMSNTQIDGQQSRISILASWVYFLATASFVRVKCLGTEYSTTTKFKVQIWIALKVLIVVSIVCGWWQRQDTVNDYI